MVFLRYHVHKNGMDVRTEKRKHNASGHGCCQHRDIKTMQKFKCEVTKCDCSSQMDTDLGEDAGSRSDSAVHHAVENGKQAIQREGFWPQKMVTCLEKRSSFYIIYIYIYRVIFKTISKSQCYVKMITFSFFFKKLVFLILPWCCWEETGTSNSLIPTRQDNLISMNHKLPICLKGLSNM